MQAAAWLFLGVFGCSTAVILIKESALDPALLSALRLLLAALLLSPLFLHARAQHRDSWRPRDALRSVPPALALAAHFISWVAGARATLAANASLIVNMVPLVMPFFLALFVRERIRRAELVGTALGLSGVVVLSFGDFSGSAHLTGDLICFGSMLFFALYLTLGRKNRHLPSIWLYVAPLYAVAGVVCLLAALVSGSAVFAALDARELGLVAALAVVPTIVGHSLLNLSLRSLPGATVSVCNLAQFLFAGALAWALFGELPKPAFWPASALIIAGAVISLFAGPRFTPSQ